MLRSLLADETQLTYLALRCKGEYSDTLRVAELSCLTALQHLDASAFADFTYGDRRALRRLQQLTTLKMPYIGWVGNYHLVVMLAGCSLAARLPAQAHSLHGTKKLVLTNACTQCKHPELAD